MTTTESKPGILINLGILHKALLAGQVTFALVAFYLVYTNSFTHNFEQLNRLLQAIALAISAGGFYTGLILFKKKLSVAREQHQDVKEKLAQYRKACLIQWSLIEGPCLFVILSFLLTHNYAFIALAAVLMLLFTLMAPSKSKIALQLQVSEEELNVL